MVIQTLIPDVNLTCVYDDLEAFANDMENAMSAGENSDWSDFGEDVWSGIHDLYNAVEGCQPAEPWWEKIFDDLKKVSQGLTVRFLILPSPRSGGSMMLSLSL